MNTNEVILISLYKKEKNDPWIVVSEAPSGIVFETTIGKGGQTPVGELFNKVLKKLEEDIGIYPFNYDMKNVSNLDVRKAEVKFLSNRPVFFEIPYIVQSFLIDNAKRTNIVVDETIVKSKSGLSIFSQSVQENNRVLMVAETYSEQEVTHEYVENQNKFWIFMDTSSIEVIDGDTFKGYIKGFGWPDGEIVPVKIGEQELKSNSKKVSVRMLGLDSFELDENKKDKKKKTNYEKAKLYGVPHTYLKDAAMEAKLYSEAIIKNYNVMAISLQYDSVKNKATADTYGRLLGVSYLANYENWESAANFIDQNSFKGANLNKELLKANFSQSKELLENYKPSIQVPLVEFVGNTFAKETDGLIVSKWASDLHLSLPPTKELIDQSGIGQNQSEIDKNKEIEQNVQITKSNYKEKGNVRDSKKMSGYTNNDLSFVVPFDDRLASGELYNADGLDEESTPWAYRNKVRIGDVMLTIPPLAVRMDKQYLSQKVKTMRSKSSLQKNVGSVKNILTLDLYFHDLESINGYKAGGYVEENGKQVDYYMDGFRPLLAQFKKAPFLPIDNEYINDSLGIHNVALHSIQTSTVPGFPQALKATLMLEEFDSKPYLMGNVMLGDKINYPLLRWYYQRSLNQPAIYEPWRTYLPEIEHLDNNFSFYIVDEQELASRKEAVRSFRQMQTPYEYEQSLMDESTEDDLKNKDAHTANVVLKQYEKFINIWKFDPIVKKYKEKNKDLKMHELPVYIGKSSAKKWGVDDETRKVGIHVARELYGINSENPTYSNERNFYEQSLYRDIFSNDVESNFYPANSYSGAKVAKKVFDHKNFQFLASAQNANMYMTGVFQVYFESDEAKEMFKQVKVSSFKNPMSATGKFDRKDLFLVEMHDTDGFNDEWFTKLKQIAKKGETLEWRVDQYKTEYNSVVNLLNRTEENMKMIEWKIPDMIPIDLTVSLSNQFATTQVQAAETPTLQYFGSQDPEIQMSFETNDAGVRETENMFRKIGNYIKEYREGIVSGFMGVTNPLVNMFGITNIIPQSVQYSTVAGHPDRKIVTITASAFDKTQRRQEALYGYTAGDVSETLRDRAYDNYDPSLDSMYVHERMRQMEMYPDMELPMVKELNDSLRSLNAKLTTWENRTEQVYLDPDFYISTKETYRNFLKDVLDDSDGINVVWEDAAGYMANSSLKDGNPLQMEDASAFEKEAEEVEFIDPIFKWKNTLDEDGEKKQKKEDKNEQASVIADKEKLTNQKVVDYIKKGSYKKPPSFEEWKKWDSGNSERVKYVKWLDENKKPISEEEIWMQLADSVMTYFGPMGLIYAKNEEAVLKGTKTDIPKKLSVSYTENKALGKLVKYNYREYYQRASFIEDNVVNTAPIKMIFKSYLKNGRKPITTKEDKSIMSYLLDVFDDVSKIPFQRVLTYMKAVVSLESGWKQFNEKGEPLMFSQNQEQKLPTKVGIMGARLSEIKDASEAQKVIWDWRQNIDTSVKQMAKVYKQAQNSKFEEIFVRRLDWAIASHSGAPLPKIISSNDKKDDVPNSYMGTVISPESSNYFLNVMDKRKRDEILITTENATGIYTGASESPIRAIYDLYNSSKSQLKTKPKNDPDSYKTDKEKLDEGYEKEFTQMHENLERWTPEEKLKGMFVDMYEYDHTGRMLRAFPCFSLQLIDEGKWYDNFRTWDNFYGYNALNSIDVYKSRKIAGDTAVIQMSNMYSGLTSKRKDMEYTDLNLPGFFSSQFWEQYVFNKPTPELLEKRQEIFTSMMLEPGARIHLRMGYGSDARALPVTFNGTITEVSAGDIVEVTAQGDGMELTNVISGSEKDKNEEFMQVIEPSDYIGKLLTSKGNWAKDIISDITDGKFFKESPLGIAHFGSTVEPPNGTWNPFSSDYGEAVQNVFSQNGMMTKEQWARKDGTKISIISGMLGSLGNIVTGNGITNDYDEDNIRVKLYGNTPWDIIQTFTLCSNDYTSAAFPFAFRSSLFFGKPHWPVTYDYDYKFTFDKGNEKWKKEVTKEHKKTFMQAHIYSSQYNILHNDMRASEEGLFNNVIVSYDGKVAGPVQADNDIRLDRQKTAMVEANIMAKWGPDNTIVDAFGANYWTAESQALRYGYSTVRDYMKDMYKGTYTVLGDPTVKPHDVCYLSDTVLDIQGIHLVKAVHHSMSLETGFISIIEPDAYVVNWDSELLFLPDKIFSVGKNVATRASMLSLEVGAGFMLGGSVLGKMMKEIDSILKLVGTNSTVKQATNMVGGLTNQLNKKYYSMLGKALGDSHLQNLVLKLDDASLSANAIVDIQKALNTYRLALKENKKAFKTAKKIGNIKGSFATKSRIGNAVSNFKLSRIEISNPKIMKEVLDAGDNIEDVVSGYRKAKTLGNIQKVTEFGKTLGKTGTTIAKKAGTAGKMLITSSAFWTVGLSVIIEVATSGLLEMWTRRKQNAECVKVIPLQYRGKSWTAGMSGHRGGVWGDESSLADRIMNGEFGDGDDSNDGSIFTFIPKVLNLFAGDTYKDE